MAMRKPSFLRKATKAAGFLWSAICMAALFSTSACAAGPSAITADLGKPSSLSLGQKLSINGEPLEITFDSVINDSRCPTGVT